MMAVANTPHHVARSMQFPEPVVQKCLTCKNNLFQSSSQLYGTDGGEKMVPLTIKGHVHEGICLDCLPKDQVVFVSEEKYNEDSDEMSRPLQQQQQDQEEQAENIFTMDEGGPPINIQRGKSTDSEDGTRPGPPQRSMNRQMGSRGFLVMSSQENGQRSVVPCVLNVEHHNTDPDERTVVSALTFDEGQFFNNNNIQRANVDSDDLSRPQLPTRKNTQRGWACKQCTFHNSREHFLACEMCGKVRSWTTRIERNNNNNNDGNSTSNKALRSGPYNKGQDEEKQEEQTFEEQKSAVGDVPPPLPPRVLLVNGHQAISGLTLDVASMRLLQQQQQLTPKRLLDDDEQTRPHLPRRHVPRKHSSDRSETRQPLQQHGLVIVANQHGHVSALTMEPSMTLRGQHQKHGSRGFESAARDTLMQEMNEGGDLVSLLTNDENMTLQSTSPLLYPLIATSSERTQQPATGNNDHDDRSDYSPVARRYQNFPLLRMLIQACLRRLFARRVRGSAFERDNSGVFRCQIVEL